METLLARLPLWTAAPTLAGLLDYATNLEGIGDAYAAIDERRAIKSLVRVGTI